MKSNAPILCDTIGCDFQHRQAVDAEHQIAPLGNSHTAPALRTVRFVIVEGGGLGENFAMQINPR